MKNLVFVLLALLAVPAFAAPTLTLTAGTNPGEVILGYTTDGDLISGMGITVEVDVAGVITSVIDLQGDSGDYNIHPTYLQGNPTAINTGTQTIDVYGSPVVSNDGTTVVLEYATLYDRDVTADAPAASGQLCKITVNADCTVTATANHAGGVVTELLVASAPTIDLAVTVGSGIPGDINGGGCVDFQDFLRLRASYGKSLGDDGYNPDANIYNEGTSVDKVDFQDFLVLRTNYGTGTCPE